MAHPKVIYASYDGFLKTVIESYWETRRNSVHFLALLLASREAWSVAWEGFKAEDTGRRALMGAGGAAAIYVLLRIFIGGPIGLVLTGVSIASLVAAYSSNHRRIWDQQDRYRKLIGDYRVKYDKIRADWLDGTISEESRDLMIDGLLNRFHEDIDDDPTTGRTPTGLGDASKRDGKKDERGNR
jgi:hypothetical protein